jgi:hypothetical protein
VKRRTELRGRGANCRRRLAGRIDELRQFSLHARPHLGQRRQAAAGDIGEGLGRRLAAQRVLPGEQLVEHHPGRIHVALRPGTPTAGLLRRHVRDGTDDVAFGGERVPVQKPRDPEVHDLHVTATVQHHVLRLHIGVDDSLAVSEGQSIEELGPHSGHVAVAELANKLMQGFADHELPHQVAPLPVTEPVIERDDVGMGQGGGGLDLADHAARHAASLAHDLERDRFVELQVARLIDLGKAARPDVPNHLVAVAPVGIQGGGAVGWSGHGRLDLGRFG